MGSLDTPTITENGTAQSHATTAPASNGDQKPLASANGAPVEMTPESEATKRRRSSVLPLEVGTRVMCRWRDGKYHPVKVIERRKMLYGGPNDYEYYVHYTECKISSLPTVRVFYLNFIF